MQIGKRNKLIIDRITAPGAFLKDEDGNEVLLPGKYLNDDAKEEDELDVFVYRDSEDRIVATTEEPYLELGEIVYLKAKDVSLYGVFVDWGLEKDLLIPYKEQKQRMEEGAFYPVCLLLDEATDRLYGTTKIEKNIQKCDDTSLKGEMVDLQAWNPTPLGRKMIVNKRHQGLVFQNDVNQELFPGKSLKGYVTAVREDGKLDLSIRRAGKEGQDDAADKLMELLQVERVISVGDKSDPDEIRNVLGMSKKTFKKAAGKLYKERLITIEPDCIRLLETK